ncbi:MAG: UDP-N-acetylglucosamine--LPS N-acetylglucosamine transferase [Planctomycetota bacterium]
MADTFEPIPPRNRRLRVLAVSSSGGHFVQLLHICAAFDRHNVSFATTSDTHRSEVGSSRFHLLPDANRGTLMKLGCLVTRIAWVVLKVRPDVVVSTGAAPGLFALAFGRLIGARTIWVDSIANPAELSMSGKKAGRFAQVWLTQWQNLARPDGPTYVGSVV